MARWYSHGNLKKAAEWVDLIHNGKKAPPGVDALLTGSVAIPSDLAVVAAAVRDLQQPGTTLITTQRTTPPSDGRWAT